MSPYATHLAHARLHALRQLVLALNQAESPDEKRRCAVAIFNAPDPCELDEVIELEEEPDQGQINEPSIHIPTADQAAPTANAPIVQVAPRVAAHSESPSGKSEITNPQSEIQPEPEPDLTPAQRRLRAREKRQLAQMARLRAQLAALPIPSS